MSRRHLFVFSNIFLKITSAKVAAKKIEIEEHVFAPLYSAQIACDLNFFAKPNYSDRTFKFSDLCNFVTTFTQLYPSPTSELRFADDSRYSLAAFDT